MANQTEEQFDADLEQRARRAVKVSLVLDQLAREEELSVDQAELSAYITRQAEQMGVPPERLAQQLAEDGRLSVAAAEVLRGKAMNLIAERVKVTDTAGHEVDVKAALNAPLQAATTDDADDDTGDDDADDAEADDDAEDA
jgi:trigger factor